MVFVKRIGLIDTYTFCYGKSNSSKTCLAYGLINSTRRAFNPGKPFSLGGRVMPKGEASRKTTETLTLGDTANKIVARKSNRGFLALLAEKLRRRSVFKTRKPTIIDPYIVGACLLLIAGFSVCLFITAIIAACVSPNITFLPGGAFMVTLRMIYKIAMTILKEDSALLK